MGSDPSSVHPAQPPAPLVTAQRHPLLRRAGAFTLTAVLLAGAASAGMWGANPGALASSATSSPAGHGHGTHTTHARTARPAPHPKATATAASTATTTSKTGTGGAFAVAALRPGEIPTIRGLSRSRVLSFEHDASVGTLYAQYVRAGEGRPVSNQVIEAEAAAQRFTPAQTLASITETSASATLLGLANHLMVAPAAPGAYRAHTTFGQGAGYTLGNTSRGDFFGTINGSPTGYCANKGAANPTGTYSAIGRGTDTTDADYRVDYVLFTYGSTRDATQAAAVSVIEHGLLGDNGYGTGDLANGAWATDIGAAQSQTASVKTEVAALWAAAGTYRGPYNPHLDIAGGPYAPGQKVSVNAYVTANGGSKVPGVAEALTVSANLTRSAQSLTTDGNGNGSAAVTINPGATGAFTVSGTPTNQLASRYTIYGTGSGSCTGNGQTSCVQRLATGTGFTLGGASAGGTITPATVTPTPTPMPTPTATGYSINASLTKSTDDPGYVSADGAVFSLHQDSQTANEVARGTVTGGTLTFPAVTAPDANNHIYCVREESAPAGVNLAPDQCHLFGTTMTSYTFDYTGANADTVARGELQVHKTDPGGAQLAGAVFTLSYDSDNNGSYDTVNAALTTDGTGTATFATLLPGNYSVAETTPPAGHVADPTAQTFTIGTNPAQSVPAASLTFTDARAVPQAFQKSGVAGTYDTAHAPDFTGAVITVTGGGTTTSCTLDAAGACTTDPVLTEGEAYTWTESSPPTNGQWSGADPATKAAPTGTFTAAVAATCPATATTTGPAVTTQPDPACAGGPVTFTDTGLEQPVSLHKVEAGKPSVPVAGATFSLCAAAGQTLPSGVTYAAGVGCAAGETYVATATTDASGTATFGPLLPVGLSYCATETAPAPGYFPSAKEICGTQPATATATATTGLVLDVSEVPAMVVTLHKTELMEGTDTGVGISGAVYDLCSKTGQTLPAGSSYTPPTAPKDTVCGTGETFVGRATTGPDGAVSYPAVPGDGSTAVDYCARELSVPPLSATQPLTYTLDPGEHCTQVTDTAAVLHVTDALTVTVPQVTKTQVGTGTGVPGATYAGCTTMTAPGATYPSAPAGNKCQLGETYLGTTSTSSTGEADITAPVPSGATVCVYETSVPTNGTPYTLDTTRHCATMTGPTDTIGVTDSVATGTIGVHKQDEGTHGPLAGAVYAACTNGPVPGTSYPAAPAGTACPQGMTYLGSATTGGNGTGMVTLPVTMGSKVCVLEATAPAGYGRDATVHCNQVLTASDILGVADTRISVKPARTTKPAAAAPATAPVTPKAPTQTLAFTGMPIGVAKLLAFALGMLAVGVTLIGGTDWARRRMEATTP